MRFSKGQTDSYKLLMIIHNKRYGSVRSFFFFMYKRPCFRIKQIMKLHTHWTMPEKRTYCVSKTKRTGIVADMDTEETSWTEPTIFR